MARQARLVALMGLVLWAASGSAQEAKPAAAVRIIPLQFASAVDLARMFAKKAEGAATPDQPDADRREFLVRALTDATRNVRPVPRVMTEPGLYPFPERTYAEARVAQANTGSGGEGPLATLLPKDLSEPPTALLDQNALIVKGTLEAIDEFKEILAILDVPPKQVNIEVKLVNLTERLAGEQGADLAGRGGNVELFLNGPAPAGPTVRPMGGNIDALLAGNRSLVRSNDTVGASVTTTNNTPCLVRAATVIPVVLASITYDQFGQRHVDYTVDAVATGVELFALPRINRNDTVSMYLRPSFIDATGQVVGPDGSSLPITQETAVETMVCVPDGESVLIGGFPRSSQALEAVGVPVHLRQARTLEDLESLLFVTPRILRLIQP